MGVSVRRKNKHTYTTRNFCYHFGTRRLQCGCRRTLQRWSVYSIYNLRRHRGRRAGQRVRYSRSACPVPYFHSHSHSADRPLRGRSLTSVIDEDSVVQSTVSHVNVRQSGHDSLQELYQPISLVIGNRLRKSTHLQYRDKVLINPPIKSLSPSDRPIHFPDAPTVYVLNCGSIVKPHAFEQLKIEINNINPEIIVCIN